MKLLFLHLIVLNLNIVYIHAIVIIIFFLSLNFIFHKNSVYWSFFILVITMLLAHS